MPRYANLGGDSGVVVYRTTADSITVEFRDNMMYLYNHVCTGKVAAEHMKSLAAAGRGLNSYITTTVGLNYALKLRKRVRPSPRPG